MEISIHMDPIAVDDELTNSLKEIALAATAEISEEVTIHDFRVVEGNTHTNLIFDAVVPYKFFMSDEEFVQAVSKKIKEKNPTYFTVIQIDRSYI